jgi:hypothetical protein
MNAISNITIKQKKETYVGLSELMLATPYMKAMRPIIAAGMRAVV